jgi:hypothetical protein
MPLDEDAAYKVYTNALSALLDANNEQARNTDQSQNAVLETRHPTSARLEALDTFNQADQTYKNVKQLREDRELASLSPNSTLPGSFSTNVWANNLTNMTQRHAAISPSQVLSLIEQMALSTVSDSPTAIKKSDVKNLSKAIEKRVRGSVPFPLTEKGIGTADDPLLFSQPPEVYVVGCSKLTEEQNIRIFVKEAPTLGLRQGQPIFGIK